MAQFTINKRDINGKSGDGIEARRGKPVSFKTGGGRRAADISIQPVSGATPPLFKEGDSFRVTEDETSRTVSDEAACGTYTFVVPTEEGGRGDGDMTGEITVNSGI